MASSVQLDTAWLQSQILGRLNTFEIRQSTIALTLLALILVPAMASSLFRAKGNGVPVVNPPRLFQLEIQKKVEFIRDGIELLREGRRRFPGKPFVLLTNLGSITILPPDRAKEVKTLPEALSFRKTFSNLFPFFYPPGFGPLAIIDHSSELLQKVVTKHLTKRLNTVTRALAVESSFAASKAVGEKTDWFEVPIYQTILDMVARISSRVFLGSELCHDENWLDLTKNFTVAMRQGELTLRLSPRLVRPIVYLFDGNCRKSRQAYYRAYKIVEPLLAQRRKERQDRAARGEAAAYNDAIEWADMEAAGASYNATDFQLMLSFAAIHTTSDLLSATMLQLAADPENIKTLRREMMEILPANGWKKTSLTQLKLLDSAIKEAQRVKPIEMVNMLRKATADIEIEGGVVVRKGDLVAVDAGNLHNPAMYKNPETYDMYRFADMRSQPGGEHRAPLVSTVPEHLTFGYGKYACPGRFFAANEIKITLCHLLMKYDWELAPGTTLEPLWFGTDPLVNPHAKLLCRRRKEEFDLDALEADNDAE